MTPLELSAYSEGVALQEHDAYRRIIYGAYITAKLGRVKDFPDLEELLPPEPNQSKKEQSPEEMFEIIKDFDKHLKARG